MLKSRPKTPETPSAYQETPDKVPMGIGHKAAEDPYAGGYDAFMQNAQALWDAVNGEPDLE